MSRNLSSFPRPFIITVGVPKGGATKTWTTLNVASQFGLWGYDVLAIDTNAQHDRVKDWHDITLDGLWPRFEVIWHQPFDKNDEQAPLLDLTPMLIGSSFFTTLDSTISLRRPDGLDELPCLILPVSLIWTS